MSCLYFEAGQAAGDVEITLTISVRGFTSVVFCGEMDFIVVNQMSL